MLPAYHQFLPGLAVKKRASFRRSLFLASGLTLFSVPAIAAPLSSPQGPSHQGHSSQAKPSSNEDLLLKGLPQGWDVHVIGVGKAQQDVPPVPHTIAGKTSTLPDKGKSLKTSPRFEHPVSTETSRNRILIPISPEIGVAAYNSGNKFVIVVDNTQPMDTSSLRGDGIFSKLTVQSLPQVTLITVPLPDRRKLFLSQQSEGWVLGDAPPPGGSYQLRKEIVPRLTSEGLLLPMRKPGRVFSITDPVSHQKLLVATSTLDDGGILSLRHGAQYDLWPTLEGVVVNDQTPEKSIEMRRTDNGVILSIAGKPLPDLDQAIYANDVDLKWLGLRHNTPKEAEERYHQATLAAADSTPQERFQKRIEAAQAALNTGDFISARTIITVALEDDPEESLRPDIRFLAGAIALLNGDLKEAELLDAKWPEDDLRATQLWKGLYYAVLGKNNDEAAHLLSNDFQRLQSYPDILRPILLPIATEQIARYGTIKDMKILDNLPETPDVSLAFALRDLRMGKGAEAGKRLDALRLNPDVILAEKATEAKISLDLNEGRLKPEEAIKKFAALQPDARLARREALVLMLQADAAMRSQKWEQALSALDQGKDLSFQKYNQRYLPMLTHILNEITKEPATALQESSHPDLRKAAILRAHLPDIPDGPDKATLLVSYGKLLSTLGLLKEASQTYSSAIPMLQNSAEKTEATNLLATSYLQRGNYKAANHVLTTAHNAGLSPEDKANRNRLIAQVAVASGKPEVALYLLNGDKSLTAADMKARIHENRGEWALAIPEVRKIVETDIADKGDLTLNQQLLALRLASDASRAKDAATLNWLMKKIDNRPFSRETDHIFKLLVAPDPSGNALGTDE